MAIGLDEGIIVNPIIEPSDPISVNKLSSIPATAAATTEGDGLDGLIGQLYTTSVDGRIEEHDGTAVGISEGSYQPRGDSWVAGSWNWRFTPGKRKKKIHQRLTGKSAMTRETASNCLNDASSETKCSGMKKVSNGR